MKKIMALTALSALTIAGCGGSAVPHHVARRSAAASGRPAGVPGAAPAVASACQQFRSASSVESKANPNNTNLAAIKAYAEALIGATKPLNVARPDPDPGLANALDLAGAANLAIADGYEPHGLQAAYSAATRDVKAVGRECTARGY